MFDRIAASQLEKQVTTMLTAEQHEVLLKGVHESRIAQRKGGGGKQLSYLEAWDVKAHLIRVFGFAGFSADVISADLMFEEQTGNNWQVGYKVVLRLTLHGVSPLDEDVTYTEAAVGSASLPQRGEAHDMAIKTAESDALKRAAINLGDQFGLSLYNNGSTRPVVMGVKVVNVPREEQTNE
jgi:recombination DNA repair RAD52 pathway protein